MNRTDLKKFVTKVLLEKVNLQPTVHGKLVKKTIGFRGIERECVCEGTVSDVNSYATENGLKFVESTDSHFGGHFIDEMTSYEFHPNPEFYGEMMELNMSARDQLSRICGTNDQILTEVDAQNAEDLVDYILTNESFRTQCADMVFERIESYINNKIFDKTQFNKLFEYLVTRAVTLNEDLHDTLSESELKYGTELLSRRFFNKRETNEVVGGEETKCGKKSFKAGNAFENMQRIVSGHQMFL